MAEEQLNRSVAILDDLAAAVHRCRLAESAGIVTLGSSDATSQSRRAACAYSRSSEYYEKMGYRWEAATAHAWLGKTEREIGHTVQAIDLLRRAQASLRSLATSAVWRWSWKTLR